MAGSTRRLYRDWRIRLLVSIFWLVEGAWMLWSSLSLSATYGTLTIWVPTDNIAYFGWGALSGAFVPFLIVLALFTLLANRPLVPSGPVFRLRDRPTIMFLTGLAVGITICSFAVIAGLVILAVNIPWPAVWGLGFAVAVIDWIPIFYAGFLGYFSAHAPRLPVEA
jgi:hypothetical protein